MNDELTRDYVLHVAHLGRLKLTEDEIERYRHQLKQILNEINKINELDIDESEIMISPSSSTNVFGFNSEYKENPKDIFNNAPKTNGSYIEVRWEKDE